MFLTCTVTSTMFCARGAGGGGWGWGGYKQQLLLSDGASVDFSVKYLQSIQPGNKKQNNNNETKNFREVKTKHGKRTHKRGNELVKQVLVVVSPLPPPPQKKKKKKRSPYKIDIKSKARSVTTHLLRITFFLPPNTRKV